MNLYRRLEPILQSDLSTADRLVLIVMAHHANRDTLQCRLSAKTIADEAGLTRRGAYKVVARLESLGWLSRSQQGLRGRKASNVYTLNLEPKSPAGMVNRVPYSDDERATGIGNRVPGMVNVVHKNGERGSQGIEPKSEPVKNRPPDGGAALECTPPPAPKPLREQVRQLSERYQLKSPQERERAIATRLHISIEAVRAELLAIEQTDSFKVLPAGHHPGVIRTTMFS